MNKARPNKLFLLPTDECDVFCEFCSYRDRWESACGNENTKFTGNTLQVGRGRAKENLLRLIDGADVIGFSGGGEPLLNMRFILETIALARKRRFVIATAANFPSEEFKRRVNYIDNACLESQSSCSIRISLDRFHARGKAYDCIAESIEWALTKQWKRCKNLFFRTNFVDDMWVRHYLSDLCSKRGWTIKWDTLDLFTRIANIEGHPFRVIYRPLINPKQVNEQEIYNIYEYMNLLSYDNRHPIRLGTPKGCHGCNGCTGEGIAACEVLTGLDITIDTNGHAYLYGAEMRGLGSIYDDKLSFEQLRTTIEKDTYLRTLRNNNFDEILRVVCEDAQMREIVERVNYPYAVIKALNAETPYKLHTALASMITLGCE